MLASMFVAYFASLLTLSIAQDACSSAPCDSLGCLKDVGAASTLCANVTRTTTSTLTTSAVLWVTETASFGASGEVTVTDSSFRTKTVTITTNLGSTVTSFTTHTNLASTLFTTYTRATPTAQARRLLVRQTPTPPACTSSAALATLSELSPSQLETACSCLGILGSNATCTTTKTASETSTSTIYEGSARASASATTLLMLAGVTYTETVTLPPSTVWLTVSTSATSTRATALAAPSFTQVFGPKPGCIDQASSGGDQLDASVTDIRKATQECQDLCAQIGLCEHVYVQRLFVDY
ncbi:hypothetical protein B0A55_04489, partial [Friedmanniomyces simplex]